MECFVTENPEIFSCLFLFNLLLPVESCSREKIYEWSFDQFRKIHFRQYEYIFTKWRSFYMQLFTEYEILNIRSFFLSLCKLVLLFSILINRLLNSFDLLISQRIVKIRNCCLFINIFEEFVSLGLIRKLFFVSFK